MHGVGDDECGVDESPDQCVKVGVKGAFGADDKANVLGPRGVFVEWQADG